MKFSLTILFSSNNFFNLGGSLVDFYVDCSSVNLIRHSYFILFNVLDFMVRKNFFFAATQPDTCYVYIILISASYESSVISCSWIYSFSEMAIIHSFFSGGLTDVFPYFYNGTHGTFNKFSNSDNFCFYKGDLVSFFFSGETLGQIFFQKYTTPPPGCLMVLPY